VCEVLRIAVDVSKAMVYLHTLQPQVVHRDLKPQNVLLDLQGRAKVREDLVTDRLWQGGLQNRFQRLLHPAEHDCAAGWAKTGCSGQSHIGRLLVQFG
jgi:serine/threonine protein kinase